MVITILALMVSVAVFNAPPPRSSAKDEAERFAARLIAASEDAVLQGSVMSVEMTPFGYRILRYANGEWRADENAGRFSDRAFAPGVAVTLTLEDAALANKPPKERMDADAPQRIILDPVGVAPAFSALFADDRERWIVRGNENQTVEVQNDGRR